MDNDTTLQSYNDHINEYIASMSPAINADIMTWIDHSLALITKNSKILELGSGAGRDADYVESKGFKVTRSDAAQGFVDLLREQGHEARLINALADDYGEDYDAILANAVLLHFTPEQTAAVLKKVLSSLKPGGIFAFTLKKGRGSEWSEAKVGAPRYFKYWEKSELENLLAKTGFKIVEILSGASRKAEWLQVIAKK